MILFTFKKTMTGFVNSIVSELKKRFVNKVVNEWCCAASMQENNKEFAHILSALFATDEKFHHANRPLGK